MKRLFLVLITALVLWSISPTSVVFAGDRAPERPPTGPVQGDEDISLPDAKTLAKAQKEKLRILPVTQAQNDRWEKEFERQMMALKGRLPASTLERLDMDTVSRYIDMDALQKASGLSDLGRFDAPVSARSQVDLSTARHGDFLLGHKSWRPWGYWGHAGMWDANGGYNKTVHARGYGWGVRRDPWNWFATQYTHVAVMGVWTSDSIRNQAGGYAVAQLGEPYTLWTSKTNQSKWYCSKLVWASYYWRSGKAIDLDSNGGFWVTPNNLWYSQWTYVRSSG